MDFFHYIFKLHISHLKLLTDPSRTMTLIDTKIDTVAKQEGESIQVLFRVTGTTRTVHDISELFYC